jgi:pimeloyl-ACP methyl ester carboxylesterase
MEIVFVHGALVFDGAWWWHRMIEPLSALGLSSRAVELPSCVAPPGASGGPVGDMYADADAVRAALEEKDEPVVLVGHSYGGMGMNRYIVHLFETIPADLRPYQEGE